MPRPSLPLFLLLCWLGLAVPAQAAFELTPQSSGASLNEQIDLLEDPDGKLGIQDMASPAVQQRFTPANGRASVGQSRSVWWVRVQLSRSNDAPKQWWLENGREVLTSFRYKITQNPKEKWAADHIRARGHEIGQTNRDRSVF